MLEWWQVCIMCVVLSACKWVGRMLLFRGLPVAVKNAIKNIRTGGDNENGD